MELQKFISTTLLSIVNAIKEANTEIDCFELSGNVHGRKMVDGAKVDLTVAVEEQSEDGLNKGGGIKINILSAGVDSQQKEIQKNSASQRIQFSVFINDEKLGKEN